MSDRLAGRVALVTGGGSGIGRAAVLRFAAEGVKVLIADRDQDAAQTVSKELGPEACAVVVGGVSLAADAERMTNAALEKFGRFDILVNNAGLSMSGSVVDMPEADWRRVFDVNLTSMFLMCKYAIPAMTRGGGGNIVNTGSGLGVIIGPGGKAAYSTSKAGVIHLTKCLAIDHAAAGIRVNCVCPGPVESPMFLRNPAELRERLAQSRPLRRLGRAEEIANAMLFFASDESSYITGHALMVDGGGSIV